MKKYIRYSLVLLTTVALSSCSMLNSWAEPTQAYIKVDYKNGNVTVNNTTGHDYWLKLVSNEKKGNSTDTMKTNDYIDIKQGKHSYSLNLRNVAPEDMAFYTNFDIKNMKLNSMYIYTSITSNVDSNIYGIVYSSYSMVESNKSDGEVLFNSNLTDNYFKMIGFPVSNGGGVSTNEITTTITVNSSNTLTIGGIYHDTNTESSSEPMMACEADDPSCDG